MDLVHVRYTDDPGQREFTALISARARDYYIDDRTDAYLRGDREPARFQEFWTFHRQDDAWRLRDIEQARESGLLREENFVASYTPGQLALVYREAAGDAAQAGPGLEKGVEAKLGRVARLLETWERQDPLWNRDRMKERARQVFTAVYLAQEAGDPDAVRDDDLFPAARDHLRDEIRRRQADGVAVEYRNLCVRKVELVLVRHRGSSADDEFTARIRAHAVKVLRRGGEVVSQDEHVLPFEEYWTFGRRDGQWKLKEVLPPGRGARVIAEENVNQGSSLAPLQWSYRHPRAG